jgi:hypothetical protein
MKLVNKETVIDENTFQPQLRLTIDFPIEPFPSPANEQLAAQEIGLKLIALLKESK